MSIVQVQLMGGLGNQLHQYCAARKYAEIHGATLEVPEWAGRHIFGLSEEPGFSCDLPEVSDGNAGPSNVIREGQVDVRLGGYFQSQNWIDRLSREEIKRWLQVEPKWLDLCGRGSHQLVAHVRQGDYLGHDCYANIPERSYVRACEEHNLPIVCMRWVRQDQPRIIRGVPGSFSYLPDFLTIMQAEVILRANSTFSWWAAVLSDAQIFAPVVEDYVGEYDASFIEGNWPRCADKARTGISITDLHLRE